MHRRPVHRCSPASILIQHENARLVLVLLTLATGAFAQENPKLALAREVIAAMHADKMLDNRTVQMKQMTSQMAAVPAAATPKQRQKFEEL